MGSKAAPALFRIAQASPLAAGFAVSVFVHAGVLVALHSAQIAGPIDEPAQPSFRAGREPIQVNLRRGMQHEPIAEPTLAPERSIAAFARHAVRPPVHVAPGAPLPAALMSSTTITIDASLAHELRGAVRSEVPMDDSARTETTDVVAPMKTPRVELPATSEATGTEDATAGVDRGIEIADLPTPRYPAASRRLGEQGLVVLRVHVDANGQATRIAVVREPGHPRLVRAAVDAVRKAHFRPAQRRGESVASDVLVPIRFRLEGTDN